MTALASSDVTVTINPSDRNILGRIKMNSGEIAFGDGVLTYPFGGIEMPTIGNFGMNKEITNLQILDSVDGYIYKYDQANRKIKMFAPAPPIISEETHTAVANTITLNYPAAWIISVCTTGQNEALSAVGDTLADHQCKLTAVIADGVRTQITTYGATDTIIVTYVTQAWAELYALLVQEEAVTLATGDVNLANKMAAFGYCYDATTGLLLPVDVADTTASGEVGIKFNSATAQLNLHSDEDAHTAVVTYLKMPATGTWLYDHWVTDEDPAKAGADPYTQAFDYPLLVWGITGCLTVNSGATQKIVDQGITAAAGEVNTRWGHYDLLATVGVAPGAGHVWGAKSDVTVTAGNYVKGLPWEIPGLVPLEIMDGTIINATTLRAMTWGK